MGWSIGWDNTWKRDIGYGVPALCDHPDCNEKIDRGLNYICGGVPYGSDKGCGLFFCEKHKNLDLCERCENNEDPFEPKEDIDDWTTFKLYASSWEEWRKENPDCVRQIRLKMSVKHFAENVKNMGCIDEATKAMRMLTKEFKKLEKK